MENADCCRDERGSQAEVIRLTEQLLIRQSFEHEAEHVFSTWYSGMYVQIDLIPEESQMVISFTSAMKLSGIQRQYRQLNTLNRECSFGAHLMDPTVGCYTFRVSVWLSRHITSKQLYILLDQCSGQAQKGVIRLRKKLPD